MEGLTEKLPELKVTMLGGLRLQRGTAAVSSTMNRSHKMWGVLSYLLLNRQREVPQEELIAVFWAGERNLTNPQGALKTLLYRLRPLLRPLTPEGGSLILARRGGYLWNNRIPCQVDLELYLEQCRRVQAATLSEREQLERCRSAVALYKGLLLPDLKQYPWVGEQAEHCHTLYVEIVGTLARLLERGGSFEEMNELCARAIELDELQEDFYLYQIRALLRLGRDGEALGCYQWATDILFRKLGISPSRQLRELYAEITRAEQGIESDLGEIQENLRETARQTGAFVCEYGFFREIYRLEVRRTTRSGVEIHLALLTVALPFDTQEERERLDTVMDQLLAVLQEGLRGGDVVSRYSPTQFVVLLPGAGLEASELVMRRLLATHRRNHRLNCPQVSCRIRKLTGDSELPAN